MEEIPTFRRDDPYKRRSFRAFNVRLPERYDGMLWHRLFRTRRWDREIVAALSSGLASTHVIDVGCATGRLLHTLAEAGAQHLCGTDLAPAMIDVARARLRARFPSIELRPADAEDSLPWADAAFDVALLTGVLHHFYRPGEALREIRRVLRPEGRIIIIDPCFVPVARHVMNACLRVFDHHGDCHFYSRREVVSLLAANGFPTIVGNKLILPFSFMIIGET